MLVNGPFESFMGFLMYYKIVRKSSSSNFFVLPKLASVTQSDCEMTKLDKFFSTCAILLVFPIKLMCTFNTETTRNIACSFLPK